MVTSHSSLLGACKDGIKHFRGGWHTVSTQNMFVILLWFGENNQGLLTSQLQHHVTFSSSLYSHNLVLRQTEVTSLHILAGFGLKTPVYIITCKLQLISQVPSEMTLPWRCLP